MPMLGREPWTDEDAASKPLSPNGFRPSSGTHLSLADAGKAVIVSVINRDAVSVA